MTANNQKSCIWVEMRAVDWLQLVLDERRKRKQLKTVPSKSPIDSNPNQPGNKDDPIDLIATKTHASYLRLPDISKDLPVIFLYHALYNNEYHFYCRQNPKYEMRF